MLRPYPRRGGGYPRPILNTMVSFFALRPYPESFQMTHLSGENLSKMLWKILHLSFNLLVALDLIQMFNEV